MTHTILFYGLVRYVRDMEERREHFSAALILPITREAGARFDRLVRLYHALSHNNRLPFYFSRYGFINEGVEGKNETVLDVDGQVHPWYDFGRTDPGQWTNHKGETLPFSSYVQPAGDVPRIPTNCITLLNFTFQRAGIDLSPLNPDWTKIKRGYEMADALTPQFNGQAFKVKGLPDILLQRKELPGDYRLLYGCVKGAGYAFGSNFMDAFMAGAGGPAAMAAHIAHMKPFVADPVPVPDYLQKEIDRLTLG